MLINPDYIFAIARDERLCGWPFDLRYMVFDCDGYGKGVTVAECYWDELTQLAILDAEVYVEESRN